MDMAKPAAENDDVMEVAVRWGQVEDELAVVVDVDAGCIAVAVASPCLAMMPWTRYSHDASPNRPGAAFVASMQTKALTKVLLVNPSSSNWTR